MHLWHQSNFKQAWTIRWKKCILPEYSVCFLFNMLDMFDLFLFIPLFIIPGRCQASHSQVLYVWSYKSLCMFLLRKANSELKTGGFFSASVGIHYCSIFHFLIMMISNIWLEEVGLLLLLTETSVFYAIFYRGFWYLIVCSQNCEGARVVFFTVKMLYCHDLTEVHGFTEL